MRLMMIVKATKDSEAGIHGKPEDYEAMGQLMEDMAKAGKLIMAEGLTPSSAGKRLSISGGKVTKVTDGPFAETKELIAGFALGQFDSWDDAMYWCERFAAAIGDGESELRPLAEVEDFPADVLPPEAAAREQALRDELQGKVTQR
jgi:hypothetical protein